MSFRRVSSWLRTTSLVGCGLIGSAVSPLALGVAFPLGASLGIDEAKGRWITYQSDAGETLYALSLMPRESQNRESLRVALVVDTSASQTGVVRRESMAMVESFLKSLSTETKVALWACDVKPVDLSGGLQSADSSNMVHAMEALKMRTPLGTTDLGAALMAAQRSLGEASGGVVVYIGDGICRTNIWDDDRVAAIVEGMRAKQTSVVSMAIGPVCDVETLAVLANHSGGTVFVRSNIEKTPEEMGRGLAGAAEVEVFWPSEASLPSVISSHFPKLLPPLRGDRDSILVGQMNGKSGSGQVVLKGTMGGKTCELEAAVEAEASNPDLGFLRLVMAEVAKNDGLKMPTAGSPALRQLGVVLAKSADDLVRAGRFALQSGDAKVASEIAEEALKRDPNNEEAATLLEAAKQSLHQVTVDRVGKAKFRFVSFTKQPPNDDELGIPMDGQINVPQGGLDEFATGGDLLQAEDDLRRVVAGKMEREVADKLKKSRDLMRTDPTAAKQLLKQLQDTVLRVSELDPNLRTELNSKVSSAVQAASRQEVRVREQLAQQSQAQAAASGALALIAERRQREQTVQQLVERFNALMDEQNFMAANNDIAPVLHEIMRDEPIQRVVELESNMASNHAMIKDVIDRRWRGFVDVLYQIEASAIPISDEPPVVYPPRDQWERITALRQRFRSIDLASNAGPGERAIYSKLDQRINVDFRSDTTLSAAIETFKDIGIPIVLDLDEDSEITPDSAIEKVNFSGEVSVRSALRILLKPLELTYVIENEVMTITGKANAKTRTTKIYPVGDLVIPIMSGGMGMGGMGGGGMGGGGMGGGMGGGGMGGMGGGGMGGMGGGGMGGMGGGGMGGMGGGMFAIQDPTRKAARKDTSSTPVATPSVSIQKQAEELIRQMESASEEERVDLDKKLSALVIGELKLANQNIKGQDVDGSTVHFQNILDVVNHALREGYPQPWMYEAMSISMQACEYPAEETRRVLLSAIDFSGDVQQAISIAKHFNKIGLKEDALQVLHDVVRSQPMLSEPYEMALPIAEELQDVSALQWVCSGILGQAWTDDKLPMIERAEVAAKAAYVRLQKAKRVIESQDFLMELENAVYRDAVVRVTWTGDCDIDLLVEEPSGSICSVSNPRTLAGGMLMGDGSPSNRSKDGLCSETYVCPQGFSGKYRVMVRKSWGEVGAGKVTAHILTDYKTPHQKYHTVQISLDEKDAMVEIEVKEGHRKSPVLESALAKVEQDRKKVVKNLTTGKNAVARSFSRSETDPEVNPVGQQNGNPRNGFGGNPVGYRPDITFLPDGVQMSVTAVISGDRRYVRVTPFPFFSAITDVTTFNFVSGAGGNGGGAGGGGGGGLGGGGGGFGGGGGGGLF